MTISRDRRPCVVVMVKEPLAGRVKTRLGRDIGMTTAAWWFRHHTRQLLRRLRDPRWRLILAVSPDRAGLMSSVWPADLQRIVQGSGDLGDRMARILRRGGPVVIVGADIPALSRNALAEAIRALGSADIVLGPSFDGGYWLIGTSGLRPLPLAALKDVRWSTRHALTDTESTLSARRIVRISCLSDVDTAADLKAGPRT